MKKGDIILNPQTGRPIKIGGAVYRKLMKQGLFPESYEDSNILTNITENDDVETLKKEYDSKLPLYEHAVRGRGRYNNKLVRRKKQINSEEFLNKSLELLKSNLKRVKERDNDDDLEKLIMNELLGDTHVKKASKKKKQFQVKAISSPEVSDVSEYEDSEADSGETLQ